MNDLIAQVTLTGVTAPSFAEIYQRMQEKFQTIYGTDAYINPDSQDGQLLAIFAQALHDCNQTCVAIYQSFSPSTASGAALSTNVKINGIARKLPTRSQVVLRIIGVAGTTITEGVVADERGVRWTLPAEVIIPLSGDIDVTALSKDEGEITADANTITRIITHTKGWQTVTNPGSAILGAPIEPDGALRQRQAISTANPARTVLKGLDGGVAAIPGVIRSKVYENDTNVVSPEGFPPHSIIVVTQGGDAELIADAISTRKTPGAYTYGDQEVVLEGPGGLPEIIRYWAATTINIEVRVDITPKVGFVTSTMDLVKATLAEYISALGIGTRVDQGRLFIPAQLFGTSPLTKTFEVNAILLVGSETTGGAWLDSDVEIAFNQLPYCTPEMVTIFVGG